MTRAFILCAFLIFDLLIIILYLNFGHFRFFNLDAENNLPTMYQGAKLFLISTVCLIPILYGYLRKAPSLKQRILVWIPLFLLFLWLAIDELAQFHENTKPFLEDISPGLAERFSAAVQSSGYNSTQWVLFYLPAFLLFITYIIFSARYFYKKYNLPTLLPAITGVLCYFLVIVLEVIGMTRFDAQNYALIYLWEESLEMIGTSLISISVLTIAFTELTSISVVNLKKISWPPFKTKNSLTIIIITGALLLTLSVPTLQDFRIKQVDPPNETTQYSNTRIPSREPIESCTWNDEIRSEISLRFYIESCPDTDINILTKQNLLFLVPEYINNTSRISEYRTIDLLNKPASQSIEDNIWSRYVEPLSLEQQMACKVIRIEEENQDQKERYKIFPDLTLIRESHLAEYLDCGAYSATQTDGYFEYHPTTTDQKYLFVSLTSESSHIDLDTLLLLP